MHEFALTADRHKASIFEFLQMMGQGSRGDILGLAQSAAAERLRGADLPENFIAARFRQRSSDTFEIPVIQIRHLPQIFRIKGNARRRLALGSSRTYHERMNTPRLSTVGHEEMELLTLAQLNRQMMAQKPCVVHGMRAVLGEWSFRAKFSVAEVKCCRCWHEKELDLDLLLVVVVAGSAAPVALMGKALPAMKNRIVHERVGHPGFTPSIPHRCCVHAMT